MEFEIFEEIFDREIAPFINEINDNNPRIKTNGLVYCKKEIFKQYELLKSGFKDVIFGEKFDTNILDRHKIASCMCGSFLKVPIFNKQELVDHIKETRERIEAYFFYVNEFVAFYAACKFMSFFMASDSLEDGKEKEAINIIKNFPILPQVKNTSLGSYSNILFYLSRIKDKTEIGLDHYDKYSYSLYFYMLEEYYNFNLN